MNCKYIIYLFLVFLTITSCTTSRMKVSSVKPTEVKELLYFQPLSYIYLIEKGNQLKLNDSLSEQSEKNLSTMVQKFKKLKTTVIHSIKDSTAINNYELDLNKLLEGARRKSTFTQTKISPLLDSVLEANGQRFGLITIATGFTRSKKNYRNEILKGAGMAVATLGMYYETPIKANSSLYCIIIDSKENNMSFYRSKFSQNKEPMDKKVVSNQLETIFKGYFF